MNAQNTQKYCSQQSADIANADQARRAVPESDLIVFDTGPSRSPEVIIVKKAILRNADDILV
ncbi:hypothetical protein C8039_19525 [Halogeometricum sp. wsp3]|nr:hypothetical protein C8039_19525 [Halogeometricum sp. wsp3]